MKERLRQLAETNPTQEVGVRFRIDCKRAAEGIPYFPEGSIIVQAQDAEEYIAATELSFAMYCRDVLF